MKKFTLLPIFAFLFLFGTTPIFAKCGGMDQNAPKSMKMMNKCGGKMDMNRSCDCNKSMKLKMVGKCGGMKKKRGCDTNATMKMKQMNKCGGMKKAPQSMKCGVGKCGG